MHSVARLPWRWLGLFIAILIAHPLPTRAQLKDPPGLPPTPPTPPTPLMLVNGKVDLADTREIPMPSPISAVAAAGNGRMLLLYLKDAQKLAVFDVLDLKIRGYINLETESAKFAGGSRHILVVLPSQNILQRYSIETLQKEKTIANPFGPTFDFAMGCSSPNLALVGMSNPPNDAWRIFNTDTMTFEAIVSNILVSDAQWKDLVLRASADGQTYAMGRRDLKTEGLGIVTYQNGQAKVFFNRLPAGAIAPSVDGSMLFTQGLGVFSPTGGHLVPMKSNYRKGVWLMPSYHPLFFLGVSYNTFPTAIEKEQPNPVAIHTGRGTQPLITLPEFPEMAMPETYGFRLDDLGFDKRFHFYPQLNLFLTIPFSNDKIVARPVNLPQLLDESGANYLYVSSLPPEGKVSQPYEYQIQARSKAGKAALSLEVGPPGLAVSPEGKVTWTPASIGTESVTVIVKDSLGQEIFHTFRVSVFP